MSYDLNLEQTKSEWHGSLRSYLIGFGLSLILTCLSFALVAYQWIDPSRLMYVLAILAFVQATIQLTYFLHVGEEAKPRWESLVFWFMILVVLIVVIGSLWIMYDLDERVMSHMHLMTTKEVPHD